MRFPRGLEGNKMRGDWIDGFMGLYNRVVWTKGRVLQQGLIRRKGVLGKGESTVH